jgi:lysophospholipase L1-like esterase
MRIRRAITRWALLASGLFVFVASPALAAPRGPYYVSLGTSLSVGIQPDADGENQLTDEGYADQLHGLLRLTTPRLQLVKLGCPGETSVTMVFGGGLCYATPNSQLATAVAFLQANRGAVALVTLDIGANDVLACAAPDAPDDCVATVTTTVAVNLDHILRELRAAAGPHVRILAMNYYNPLVATWLQDPAAAEASAALLAFFNDLLEGVYAAHGVTVGDVSRAFHAGDFRIVPRIGLPLNVLLVCQWTWMCAPAPVGPNIHANRVGYFVIALTLAAALR